MIHFKAKVSSFLFALATPLLFTATAAQASPDRIGNGGGVWVCESSTHEVFDILFMDVFEARREYQLNLAETDAQPTALVKEKEVWIQKFMPNQSDIVKYIDYVEPNITWIDDVINFIPDGANKISPHPSLCKQGDWKAVQLVNFTDDFRVLVRRDLFQSPYMSNLEKAAVYLHEGIYSYLREKYHDTTSVRARAIVGFLLSDLPDQQKLERIQKILADDVQTPAPEPVPQTWICGLRPDSSSPVYIAEDRQKEIAQTKAVENCLTGQRPPGFPIGFPFPGPQMNCKADLVFCEAVASQVKSKWCVITIRGIQDKSYKGYGRTNLEAQKETSNMCMASEGDSHDCKSTYSMQCN